MTQTIANCYTNLTLLIQCLVLICILFAQFIIYNKAVYFRAGTNVVFKYLAVPKKIIAQ